MTYSRRDMSPCRWPWFHCGLTFNLTPAIVENNELSMHWRKSNKLYRLGKKKEEDQHSQTVRWHCSSIPGNSFTLTIVVQWKCGLHVASSSVCYYVFTMLFIMRTNWTYGLSVFVCINSLLYSFPCLFTRLIVLGAGCFFFFFIFLLDTCSTHWHYNCII